MSVCVVFQSQGEVTKAKPIKAVASRAACETLALCLEAVISVKELKQAASGPNLMGLNGNLVGMFMIVFEIIAHPHTHTI